MAFDKPGRLQEDLKGPPEQTMSENFRETIEWNARLAERMASRIAILEKVAREREVVQNQKSKGIKGLLDRAAQLLGLYNEEPK